MSSESTLETLGGGVKKTAGWVALFAFFPEIKKIVGEVLKGIWLIIQIFFYKSKNAGEDAATMIWDNKKAILYGILGILFFNVLFSCLGAGFQSRVLMAIAGCILIIPLIILATSGQVIGYLIGIYLATVEGTLSGFHKILISIADKLGMDDLGGVEGIPRPEFTDREKISKGAGKIWLVVIPVGLMYAFCIAFPSWKALGAGLIMIFGIILLTVMSTKFNEIDPEADSKKLIPVAKGMRRVYKLVSLGLAIFLVWVAASVAFNPRSKNPMAKAIGKGAVETENATAGYIDSANGLHNLPKKIVVDGYNATIAPILKKKAIADSLAAVREQARLDSLRRYNALASTHKKFNVGYVAESLIAVKNPNCKDFIIETDQQSGLAGISSYGRDEFTVRLSYAARDFYVTAEDGQKFIAKLKNKILNII
ncbi:MAG: hypothetical protein ABIJ91_02990 [Candidatus Kuenenbacteria bacterium]